MGEEGGRVGARLARGCRCFAVLHGDEVAAYGWLSAHPEWIGELSLEISPAAGEAYIWNCVTLPAHRRQGMYRRLLEVIVAKARAERLPRLWIGSVEDPAEKADADAGFIPVLSFTVNAFGPLRRLRARPAEGAPGLLLEAARRSLGLRGWTHLGRRSPRVH